MIEEALGHFYGIDSETLLCNYQDHLDAKTKAAPPPMDRAAAIAYCQTIPERCKKSEPFEMKTEMLSALSEDELQALCEEQAQSHPDVEQEIRSTFDFCLKIKRLL